jgi:hypothetical protein
MLKEFKAENKPIGGKFITYHRLDENTKPSNLMVANSTRTQRRYNVTVTLKVGANNMWWQTTLNADDRNQAIRKGRKLLQKDLIRTKDIGYSIKYSEAILVDKAQS